VGSGVSNLEQEVKSRRRIVNKIFLTSFRVVEITTFFLLKYFIKTVKLMKKFLMLVIASFSFFLSYSQSSNYWLQSAGSPNVDENLNITKDNANNLVSIGYFTNTITFPGGTNLTSAGSGTSDVLVQKTNSQGQVIWAVKAGGPGSDRGISVACDAIGNIYISGYYYGTAQFGSFTLNSVGGSQDIFIAKLNPTGTFLWAQSAGGSMAEDPYAITVDNLNNVIITGEFQGTAIFGTQTLTSKTNPYTNSPSFDVFTSKYDLNGNFVWVQQGTAPLDDRGIDVGTDANGNVFVCGQFSDTITFGATHLNTIQGAVFIIKYNAAGQEQWFVKGGALSSTAYGLAVDNNNDVYITGDYTGSLIFFGTPNNTLNGTYSNRIFLVKYSNSGTYLWGKEDASKSYVSSKAVALDANNNPCLFGEFDCRMDDYSILAGGTGMFNSVGFHDLFISKYDKSGNRLWERNFGGPSNDYAHGIVFTNNNTPYVCGSFNYKLDVNTTYSPFDVLSNVLSTSPDNWVSQQNCNNNTKYYYKVTSAGSSDCFILHGIDSTCAYYDYYYRSGSSCQQNFVGGCIDNETYNCQDTLEFCGPYTIIANPYAGDIGGVGPFYHFQWNTGDTTQYKYIITNGNYACVMTTGDGCFTSQDTVYVKINTISKPPTITDNLGINVNQPPATNPIIICGTGTFTLTGGNIQGCTYQWSGPGIVSIFDSSCVVNKAGTYVFTITNAFGCTKSNQVLIKFDIPIDPIKPKTNMPDTLTVCEGACTIPSSFPNYYFIYDSISNPTGIPYGPIASLAGVFIKGPNVSLCCPHSLSLIICPDTTGWINLDIEYIFSSTCGKDSAHFQHRVYMIVKPKPVKPTVTVNISGSSLLCPGDSSLLIATYTVTPTTNISISTPYPDSMWVHQGDSYSYIVGATDSLNGCTNNTSGSQSITVSTTPNPSISTNPVSGVICPNDSVQLVCTFPNVISCQWYGPSGILIPTTAIIYQHIPGFYYCIATNASGCKLTSNTIEIKNYEIPYMIALPQATVCAGQTVSLQVLSGDTTSIHWLPPLSGGGTIKTVSQSGTYSCTVTMCSVTTTCSIVVTVYQPLAHITLVGSATICPGDSVLLIANTGLDPYLWLPTNQIKDSIYAYASGTYILVATDINGCQAKDSVAIKYNPNVPTAPITTNDSICAGSQAHLQASNTGTYTTQWYAQAYSGSVINTGNNFSTPPLYTNTNYYVSIVDNSGCHSIRQAVYVYIQPTSIAPVISATKPSLCFGDTLFLHANTVAGATYNWSGPNSFTSSQINPQVNSVDTVASGIYSLFISGSTCISPTATLNIVVTKVNTPSILLANDSVCQGNSLVIQAHSSNPGVSYNWAGPNGYISTAQIITITTINQANAGTYTLQTNIGACKSKIDTIHITVKPLPNAVIHIKTNLCTGDSLILSAQATPTTAVISWTGPAGFQSNLAMPVIKPLNVSNTGYYDCYCTLNGCARKDSMLATINTMPGSVVNDTFICGNGVNINATYPNAINYLWSDGFNEAVHTVHASGTYWVTYTLSTTCVFTDTFSITIKENQLIDTLPNIVTPNNDNINDVIDFGKYHFSTFQIDIYNRWGNKIFESTDPLCVWQPVCVDGTYFYIISYSIACNTEDDLKTRRGFITVIR
jgi:hypothetical protein